MAIKEPLLNLNIETEKSGFYQCLLNLSPLGQKYRLGL